MLINNAIGAALLLLATPFYPGEISRTIAALGTLYPSALLLLSSAVVGVCLSYFGLRLQGLVSATSFLVMGAGCMRPCRLQPASPTRRELRCGVLA